MRPIEGDKMEEALIQHVRRKYNVLIGERTAEALKLGIGNAWPEDETRTMDIRGCDMVAGAGKALEEPGILPRVSSRGVDMADLRAAWPRPQPVVRDCTPHFRAPVR